MSKLRYFDAGAPKNVPVPAVSAAHSEFLRTGRISRSKENWVADERRYMTFAEVAERTGRKLTAAGEKTHERINSFHKSITFPKLVFHRTLESRPHLGYCHVTASKTKFAQFDDVKWAFFIANFFSDIDDNNKFSNMLDLSYSRMYFAVAMQPDTEVKKMTIDRTVRGNGLIFRTHDPKIALQNLLMLGSKSEKLREIIRQL